MKFGTAILVSLIACVPSLVSALLIPNADTPVFYLVGLDRTGDNFLNLRLYGNDGMATLTGDGPIAMMYYINGGLVAVDPVGGTTSPYLYRPYLDLRGDDPNGDCGTSGPLMFIQDPNKSDSKCATYGDYTLFSDRMDAQLGAKLTFRSNLTSFYSCGPNRNIYHKEDVNDEPKDCVNPVQLYTLPVV